jgi:aconitate hydratase
MPAGRWLKYRSNVPRYSEATFNLIDPDFPKRSREWGGGLIVAGENYGQGSSREHAALVPRWMGVKAVIAKSFARIHEANLVNFGILPLVFADPDEYGRIQQGDTIEIPHARQAVENGLNVIEATNLTQGAKFGLRVNLTERGRKVVLAGGMLNFVRS